jgi:hypothetical protein
MNFEEHSNQGWALPKPILTEPGVKYFLSEALKQSHIIRENFHNTLFNIGMLIFFLLILGAILVYKYKGKLTPVEISKNNNQKQQYILEKIKNFQIAKQRAQQELITGLPHWDNEYNIIHSRP